MKSFLRPLAARPAVPVPGASARTRSAVPSRLAAVPAPALVVASDTCPCGARWASSASTLRRRPHPGAKSPKVWRASRPSAKPKSSIIPDNPESLLPALHAARTLGLPEDALTDDEFLRALTAGATLYHADGQRHASEQQLRDDHGGVTPYHLHTTGVAIMCGGRAVSALPPLSTTLFLMHLANCAVGGRFGYLPSILTIVNLVSAQCPFPETAAARLRESRLYLTAEAAFVEYLDVMSGKDKDDVGGSAGASAGGSPVADEARSASDMALQADAFTLAGLLSEGSGNVEQALEWYLAAMDVGNLVHLDDADVDADADARPDTTRRAPRWTWEQRCLEGIGRMQTAHIKSTAPDAVASGTGLRGIGASNRAFSEAQVAQYRVAKTAVHTAATALGSSKAALMLATAYAHEDDDARDIDRVLQAVSVDADPVLLETIRGVEAGKASMLRALGSRAAAKEARWFEMLADEWHSVAKASRDADMDGPGLAQPGQTATPHSVP